MSGLSGGVADGVVAVLTFHRERDLRELLTALQSELGTFALGNATVQIWKILVIDNDPGRSAETVAAEFDTVRYVGEPTPGISAARNRALEEATGFDCLIFIDDDERPEPGWLRSHLKTWTDFGASAVAGAVISEFDGPLDPWLAAGGFFDRPRPPSGTPMEIAATNNLLLDLRDVRRFGLEFDARYGLTGGEDTLFTRALVAAGGSLVFCSEALVFDKVPASRMTRRWVLARYMSGGNSWALTGMQVRTSVVGRVLEFTRLTAAGLVRVFAGATIWAVGSTTRSQKLSANGLRTLARGSGLLMGACGLRYQEYRRKPTPAGRTGAAPGGQAA
jgi:succinoglycan biosynthesis protein ExoM